MISSISLCRTSWQSIRRNAYPHHPASHGKGFEDGGRYPLRTRWWAQLKRQGCPDDATWPRSSRFILKGIFLVCFFFDFIPMSWTQSATNASTADGHRTVQLAGCSDLRRDGCTPVLPRPGTVVFLMTFRPHGSGPLDQGHISLGARLCRDRCVCRDRPPFGYKKSVGHGLG